MVYGALPAGTQNEQIKLVEQASRNNKENYSFVYRPEGGFVLAGVSVSVKTETERPAAAQGCTAEKFTWVKA